MYNLSLYAQFLLIENISNRIKFERPFIKSDLIYRIFFQANKKATNGHHVKNSKKDSGSGSQTGVHEDEDGSASELEDAIGSPNETMQQLVAKIRRKSGLSNFDQELMRIVGQHLHSIGLKTTAEVLMAEAGIQLIHPTAMNFKKMVLNGEWSTAVKSKNIFFQYRLLEVSTYLRYWNEYLP